METVLMEAPSKFNNSDISSLSNIDSIVCKHHDITLAIDFDKTQIQGNVEYHFEVLKDTNEIDLDTRNLHISRCTILETDLTFQIIKYEKITATLGDQLKISIPQTLIAGAKIVLKVAFHTLQSKESALNWLNPSQTEGKVHSYMFTQCEPIWNRTIFPCQDTPAIKSTFSAVITVPKPYKAYASGRLISSQENESSNTMTFTQEIPIPSYLFAIVCGNLVEKKVSERTTVISEPEVIEKCFKELEDMEVQLQALENFITPYEWKEYKVVVLPPSFPYGGMENPLLTFASPSIIVGDKSNTDVIIHEMAHSWSGNLFSCKNWNSFWLNEGWTVYFESEIVRILHGEEAYNVKFSLLDNSLKAFIDKIGHENSYSTLNPEIGYDNPDDAFSIVPYIRGFQLLTHIQNVVGVPEFRKFTKEFVEAFKQKSLDTAEFKDFFANHFGQEAFNKIDWESWINKKGYPPQVFNIQSERVAQTKLAAKVFLESNGFTKAEWDQFSVEQKGIFLQEINKEKMTLEKAQLLDEILQLCEEINPEIYTAWFTVALSVKYAKVVPFVQKHLSLHGRMKFVRGIYGSLAKFDRELAVETFKTNQNLYYGITYTLTKADLKL